ncbi:unnamed protein product [Adineta ricciae]|uniref:Uncharacterized protein n=1 Tax=Adineta ricciae TaxID=249248 RepID=A0A814NUY1_ADIRI|nr:unnamed protein product [Adineta ricciae]CAF1498552.1 unnamed protein product [Adineta ricciae]
MQLFIDKFFPKKQLQKLSDLPKYTPLQSYRCIHIDELTVPSNINELIRNAARSTKFTLFCSNVYCEENDYIHLEIIRDSFSSMASIRRSMEYPPDVLEQIQQLFRIVMDSSNRVHIWGNISNMVSILEKYEFFYHDVSQPVHYINLQRQFKQWYNSVFPHHYYCQQILNYNTIDGPLCSCSYRPLKSINEEWDINQAIGYTFAEYLNMETVDNVTSKHICSAISTLSVVLDQQWTHEQVQNYIQQHNYSRKLHGKH